MPRTIQSTNDRLKQARKAIRRANPDRVATAYHEAGHALVASLLDLPVLFVTIRPNKDSLGRCVCVNFQRRILFDAGYGLDKLWPVDLAGIAAEKLKYPRCPMYRIEETAQGDIDDCIRTASCAYRLFRSPTFTQTDYEEFVQFEAFERAKQILAGNRETLDLLAGALLRREYLHGREVAALVHGKHQVHFDAKPCASFFLTFGNEGVVDRVMNWHNGDGDHTQHPSLHDALEPILKVANSHIRHIDFSRAIHKPSDIWEAVRMAYKISQRDLSRVQARLLRERMTPNSA